MYSPIRKSGLDILPHSKSINSFPAGDSAGMLHNSAVRVVTYKCECSAYSWYHTERIVYWIVVLDCARTRTRSKLSGFPRDQLPQFFRQDRSTIIVKWLHNCARVSHLFDANESQSHYIKRKVTRVVSKGRKASSPNHGSIKIALMSSFLRFFRR